MLLVNKGAANRAVRPHARAGVEIYCIPSSPSDNFVRPHARAGVEMPLRVDARFAAPVRPHARAGVEMELRREKLDGYLRSPSCEGGS